MKRTITALAWLFILAGLLPAETVISGYKGQSDIPQTPGYHTLICTFKADGKETSMPFALYLPEAYGQQQKWPMLVFLSGVGERGTDPQVLLTGGVMSDLARHPDVLKWFPAMILSPLCPPDVRWENDEVAEAVVRVIDEVAKRWPVDGERISVTGLSMGGTGCWAIAKKAPRRFSVVAPVVAGLFEPVGVASALEGSGTTCVVISGAIDPKSEPASGEMAAELRKRGVDVVYVPVPHGDHFMWSWFYRDQRFYEWLFSHKRGTPPPAGRLTPEGLMALAADRTSFNAKHEERLAAGLKEFAPWWHVDNCGYKGNPGLHEELAGRKKVYVTHPWFPEIPARLQTTTKLPTARKVLLNLVVGRHVEGDWNLSVRVDEHEVYRSDVDSKTAPQQWMNASIDLSAYAGKEVRLQLVQAALNEFVHEEAYWGSIEIVSQ